MTDTHSAEKSQPPEPPTGPRPEPASNATAITTAFSAIRLLRAAGGSLFSQAGLHVQLARVEWAEEKIRLSKMLAAALLVFTCLLCIMLFVGVLVLVLCWETDYRIHAVLGLIAVYGITAGIAWHRVRTLSARGDQAFAATREELAADIALIRSKL